jgi:hypothetical protein
MTAPASTFPVPTCNVSTTRFCVKPGAAAEVVLFPNTEVAGAVDAPVPPSETSKAVVNPVRLVMLEFTPLEAVPVKAEYGIVVEAVSAPLPFAYLYPVKTPVPVPPCAVLRGVVSPVKLVMSLFAPLLAALRFVRAPVAVVAPVPPPVIWTGRVPFD